MTRSLFDVIVEELEQDPRKFTVGVLRKVFEGEGSGNHLAAGIGLAFGFFFAGLELFQLIGDLFLLASSAEPSFCQPD
jgi:hypothetical protein